MKLVGNTEMKSIVNVEENWVSEKTGVRNMYSIYQLSTKCDI